MKLPLGIINIILKKTKIQCWSYKINLELNIYKKLGNKYYCLNECFCRI